MSYWDWNKTSYHEIDGDRRRIRKLREEWVWQPTKMGPSDGRVREVGQLMHDSVYECAFCKGTGERPKGYTCPVCKKKGTFKVFRPPTVVCACCKGKGEDKPRSVLTCGACKGKGVIPVKEPVELCTQCHGRGREGGGNLICGTCRGSGVITKVEGEGRYIGKPSGTERECLEVILEKGRAGRVTIGKYIGVSSNYAEYVCESLSKKGLVRKGKGQIYYPTMKGKTAMGLEVEEDDYEWPIPWPKKG